MTDRPTPEDDFNDLLEAAAAHRDAAMFAANHEIARSHSLGGIA